MRRMAIVGTGHRGATMFGSMLASPEAIGKAELVGLCDPNPLRARAAQRLIGTDAPIFTDLAQMVSATRCDTVIVTTMDSAHADTVVQALHHGCSVITEKPLTVDAASLARILEAERRTGLAITVAFNYRYAPFNAAVREFMRSGRLGAVTSVDFHWYLDTVHGADYFRRWHRQRRNSGSLWVHKATHHFDLVNWWLGETPQQVFAHGTRRVYGRSAEPHGERCMTCAIAAKCPFAFDWSNRDLVELYLETEEADGYHRDGCVFSGDVDIWDTMTALVRYSGDVLMTYSLLAYAPYEGYRIAFNGTEGRLDCECIEAVSPVSAPEFATRASKRQPPVVGDGRSPGAITFYPRLGGVERVDTPSGSGEHGGGDQRLALDLLSGDEADPLGRRAGTAAGAYSILTGIAAARSIDLGLPVQIRDLISTDLLP